MNGIRDRLENKAGGSCKHQRAADNKVCLQKEQASAAHSVAAAGVGETPDKGRNNRGKGSTREPMKDPTTGGGGSNSLSVDGCR